MTRRSQESRTVAILVREEWIFVLATLAGRCAAARIRWRSCGSRLSLLFLWLIGGGVSGPMSAQQPAPDDGPDFATFQLIVERNIFNPDRLAPRRGDPPPERESEVSRAPDRESLVLLGTIIYDQGSFAFFEGTSSAFQGTFALNESIGEFRLAGIDVRRAVLEKEGQRLTLPVGGELSKGEDELLWKVMDQRSDMGQSRDRSGRTMTRRPEERSARGETREDGGQASTPDEASAEESDILQRLMQKREQEMSDEN